MILIYGFSIVVIAFVVLFVTFFSIAKIDGKLVSAEYVSLKKFCRIYMFGSYYVTGQPIRSLFGFALTLSTCLIYPVSYLVAQKFDNTVQTSLYLILSRLLNILGQLCAWPNLAYFLDTTTVSIQNGTHTRSITFFFGTLFALTLLFLHPTAFIGLWPSFLKDYLKF